MKRFIFGMLAGILVTLMVPWLGKHLISSMPTGPRGPVPVRVSPGDVDQAGADRWTLTMDDYFFGSSLKVSDGVSSREVHPPKGKVWGGAMLHASGTALYVNEYEKLGDEEYRWESLVRIPLSKDGLAEYAFKPEVVLDSLEIQKLSGISNASISGMIDLSDDGSRILLLLMYEGAASPDSNFRISEAGLFTLSFSPKMLTRIKP